MTIPALPSPGSQIHFVGIGGIGMSGLARMLNSMGYVVSGSDSTPSALIDELRSLGIAVQTGHNAGNLAEGIDLVIRTSAVSGENPEIAAAQSRGIEVMRRAELLGAMSASHETIAVAGTHGKSTTSGMLTTALRHLGLQPTYAIGAILKETGQNAELGAGAQMIVEADEYDHSFLALSPAHAIITNAEFDHPDIFTSPQQYEQAFVDFVRLIRPGGTLVVRGDDDGAKSVLEHVRDQPGLAVRTFGLRDTLDWSVTERNGSWRVQGPEGLTGNLTMQVPGEHNALNALAVVAMLYSLGTELDAASRAVEAYSGIGRRFEIRGESAGVLVIDDYAHHPTEVEATLKTALQQFPDRRIWAAFQPHTYSRTAALIPEFAEALALAPNRILLDVYGAREQNTGQVSDAEMMQIAGADGYRAGNVADAATLLASLVQSGDVVLTMGAGDITALGPQLLALLESPA